MQNWNQNRNRSEYTQNQQQGRQNPQSTHPSRSNQSPFSPAQFASQTQGIKQTNAKNVQQLPQPYTNYAGHPFAQSPAPQKRFASEEDVQSIESQFSTKKKIKTEIEPNFPLNVQRLENIYPVQVQSVFSVQPSAPQSQNFAYTQNSVNQQSLRLQDNKMEEEEAVVEVAKPVITDNFQGLYQRTHLQSSLDLDMQFKEARRQLETKDMPVNFFTLKCGLTAENSQVLAQNLASKGMTRDELLKQKQQELFSNLKDPFKQACKAEFQIQFLVKSENDYIIDDDRDNCLSEEESARLNKYITEQTIKIKKLERTVQNLRSYKRHQDSLYEQLNKQSVDVK